MPKVIDIPDAGQVEFPDSMSDIDIRLAIQRDILKKPFPGAPGGFYNLSKPQQSQWVKNQDMIKSLDKPKAPRAPGFLQQTVENIKNLGTIPLQMAPLVSNIDPVSAARAGATLLPGIYEQQKTQFGQAGEQWNLSQINTRQAQQRRQEAAALQRQGKGREAQHLLDMADRQEGAAVDQGRAALGYGMAGVLPLAGPTAAATGEQYGRGETGRAISNTAFLIGPNLLGLLRIGPGGLTKKVGGRVFKSRLMPDEATAQADYIARAKAGGLEEPPITRGQELGHVPLQKTERALQHVWGSSGIADDAFRAEEAELQRQLAESFGKVAPQDIGKYDAGRNMREAYGSYVNLKHNQAHDLYAELDNAGPVERLPVGTRQVPGAQPEAILTPAGMPRPEIIYEEYRMPVNLQNIRNELQPLWEEVEGRFPEDVKRNSFGYTALRNIMTSPKKYMDAMKFDGELGAIKELVREGKESNLLRTPAQAIAGKVITAGEREVEAALNKVDPTLKPKLRQARDLTKEKWDAARDLRTLAPRDEAVQIFNQVTMPDDARFDMLQRVNQVAPNQVKSIFRTWLAQNFLERTGATVGAGVLKNTRTLRSDWRALGPKTKDLVFGPELTKELDHLYLNMERMVPAEGSPTAWRLPTLQAITMLTSIGHIASLGQSMAAANVLARMLFRRGGPDLISRAISLPVGSPGWRSATLALRARALAINQEQRQERESGQGPKPVKDRQTSSPSPPRGEMLVTSMAQGIQEREGWKPGSRSQRNNNPGNIKVGRNEYLPGLIDREPDGKGGYFARFKDYDAGFAALKNQVRLNIKRGMNLKEFFGGSQRLRYPGYASRAAGNDPVAYAKDLAERLGISPDQPLGGGY